MRIFDNHKKINWSLSGCEIVNREVVMPSGGKASSIISGSGTCNMTIIGKKISGDGEVVVKIVDVDRVFFKKKITFTTKSSSEFSMSLGKLPAGVTIEVSKNKNSIYGFIYLGLLISF